MSKGDLRQGSRFLYGKVLMSSSTFIYLAVVFFGGHVYLDLTCNWCKWLRKSGPQRVLLD